MSDKPCIHSRKISAFISDSEGPKFERFRRHLEECAYCRSELAREQGLLSEIESLIPSLAPSDDISQGIRSEIVEAFRGIEISSSVSTVDRMRISAVGFGEWLVDFGRFLVSKQMILTYLFSVGIGVLLKYAL